MATVDRRTYAQDSIKIKEEDPSLTAIETWRSLNRNYLLLADAELAAGNCDESPARDAAFDASEAAGNYAILIAPRTWDGVHAFLDMMLDDFMHEDAERLETGIRTLATAIRTLAPRKG
jgi:hypothetical protein